MLPTAPSTAKSEILLDYGDPQAPRITHVRGILIAGSRPALQSLGMYDRYVELLPSLHKDALLYCVANSWLPMDQTVAHFDTCDRLGLTRSHFDEIGASLAERLRKTFMATTVRSIRSMGLDGQMLWALSRTDRFLKRVYCGGRCVVEQHGPKDITLELGGLPFASSAYYRSVLLSQSRALLGFACRKLFAKYVPPRTASPESLAIAFSWV